MEKLLDTSDRSQKEEDSVPELPSTPVSPCKHRNSNTKPSHGRRPSQRLSVNLPILTPTIQPTESSDVSYTPIVLQNGPSTGQQVIRSSITESASMSMDVSESIMTESPDILTLIASQERLVLELKEELSKAEVGLAALKKQWALHEVNKKRNEIKNKEVSMGMISPKMAKSAQNDEQEWRKEAREKRLKGLGIIDSESISSNLSRKKSQRVFEGRHTRTLSLLTNTQTDTERNLSDSSKASQQSSGTSTPPTDSTESFTPASSRPSLSRQSTLQTSVSSISTNGDSLNFGKTYKDLASVASRKSLPPSADVFVKQGKQMYDGVSQGFWNFVEDIRQATVGEEAISGPPAPKRVYKKRSKPERITDAHGKIQTSKDQIKVEKDNFWREFGIETPKSKKEIEGTASDISRLRTKKEKEVTKEHESKSSTDSRNTPSLLDDLMDGNEEDDSWDAWDSPTHVRVIADLSINTGKADDDKQVEIQEVTDSQEDEVQDGTRSQAISWHDLTN